MNPSGGSGRSGGEDRQALPAGLAVGLAGGPGAPAAAEATGRTGRGAKAPPPQTMRLRVLLPTELLLDLDVVKVVAEAVNGSFGLLPRHADFATALVPGVLAYTDPSGVTRHAGVDEGALLKRTDDVVVSALDAVAGEAIEELSALVRRRFRELDEDERQARGALARLQAGALRRLLEMARERHA